MVVASGEVMAMGVRQRIGEFFSGGREVVSEIIGRVSYTVTNVRGRFWRSDDRTQADYAWYDKLRRGKLATYKLGALFAKPIIEHITAWALGSGFRAVTGDKDTDSQLADFVAANLYDIITFVQEGMALGDSYLIVNPDGTLSAVPASQVAVETDPLDYRRVVAYEITTTLEEATIRDRYALDGRTVTINRGDRPEEVQTFPLVAGRLPVVHLPYMRGTNEVFGRPIYEALVPLFAEYDDVLLNSLTGVKTMSNPIPSLEGVDDPAAELDAMATRTQTYQDESGVTRTENVIDMDAQQIIATTGSFNMKAPASFTADSWQMMKALFYLMLQHTNIPEWVWGGAIASSKASVDAQMPAWSKFIEGQRMQIEPKIRAILEIWLSTVSLYTPGLRADLPITIEWPEVAPADAEMHLAYVSRAGDRGLITDERELELLDLVKDAAAEVAAAQAEESERLRERDRYGVAWEDALADARRAVDGRTTENELSEDG